jgi:hypothetical protein
MRSMKGCMWLVSDPDIIVMAKALARPDELIPVYLNQAHTVILYTGQKGAGVK